MKNLITAVVVVVLTLGVSVDASAKKDKKAKKGASEPTEAAAAPAEAGIAPFLGDWKVAVDDGDLKFYELAKKAALGDAAAGEELAGMELSEEQQQMVGMLTLMASMGGEDATEMLDTIVGAATGMTMTIAAESMTFGVPGTDAQTGALTVTGESESGLQVSMEGPDQPPMPATFRTVDANTMELEAEGKAPQKFVRIVAE